MFQPPLGGCSAQWATQLPSPTAPLSRPQAQALHALEAAVGTFDNPAFSCALIAGDTVLLHLLHRLGYLSNSTVRVFFLDTLHLFEETHSFLHRLERSFDFSAHVFSPSIASSKAELEQRLGADVWKHQPEKYDRICKVEPFQRALNELEVDCLVNGRRRDHGHERAHLELFDAASPGEPVKLQPLAYWEFRDCFDYLDKYGVEHHPLHDQGYPSVGAPTRQSQPVGSLHRRSSLERSCGFLRR